MNAKNLSNKFSTIYLILHLDPNPFAICVRYAIDIHLNPGKGKTKCWDPIH